MQKQKLYLAHNLENREDVRKWQLRVESKYNIIFINPFYQSYRKEITDLDVMKSKKEKFEYKQKMTKSACKNIVKQDLNMIRKSDGILAILSSPTIGTAQEIFFASYVLRIPVYVITAKYYTIHPWLRTLCKEIFISKKQFTNYLTGLVGRRD